MDRQIRRLGIAFVALFAVLFAQVAYVQVVAADRIANEPANAARQISAEYAVERGQILAATARPCSPSRSPNPDPDSPYKFVRDYPGGALWGQLTGYYSQHLRAKRPRAGDEPLPRRHRAGVHDPEPHRHHPRAAEARRER